MDSVFAPNLLVGRRALVTGGGSGIGAGIAHLLAQHGATVALVGRTTANSKGRGRDRRGRRGTDGPSCNVRQ